MGWGQDLSGMSQNDILPTSLFITATGEPNKMCRRFNLVDSPAVQSLMLQLVLPLSPVRFSAEFAPAAAVSIIRESTGGRRVSDAIWWLLLDRETLKPDYHYASFNTRSDRLHQPRSAGYGAYRQRR